MIKNGNLAAAIIKPDYVLTPQGLKEDRGVRVEEGRTVCMGPWDSLDDGSNEEAQTVCLSGQVFLSGFVNRHNHMYGILSYGITVEATVTGFSDYLKDFWWPCMEDGVDHDLARITARWACIEMIDSGATSFADILEGPNSIPGTPGVEKEGVEKIGLRGYLSFEACEGESRGSGMLGLKGSLDSAKAYNEEKGLVKGAMGVHTLSICGEDFIREARRMANEVGCLLCMHMSGSDLEPAWTRERPETTPAEAYDGIGYPDGNVLASQPIQVIDKEIIILAKKGVEGTSVPLSNCEVDGGVVPIEKMLEADVTVDLGTDGHAGNFFEVMRGVFSIHRGCHKDPQAVSARKVYRMVTELGAKAVGMEADVIKEGMLADLITVDVTRPAPINEYNVYGQLVLFTNPQNVMNVMVGGAWLKEDGKLVTLDKEAVHREMKEKIERF